MARFWFTETAKSFACQFRFRGQLQRFIRKKVINEFVNDFLSRAVFANFKRISELAWSSNVNVI
jgi:hypothetical protein